MKKIRRNDAKGRIRLAHALGWKTGNDIRSLGGSSIVVLHGGSSSHQGFADGGPRYTLALLERGYELFDRERDVLALVHELPTPERAAALLNTYGVPTREAVLLESPDMLLVQEDADPG